MKITKDIDDYGNIRYYNEQGQFHREDGPAVEYAYGTKAWYLNDKPHREDGPAVEWACGDKSYYLNGQQISEQEFNDFFFLRKRLQRILEL